MDLEKDLIAAFDRIVHEKRARPDRANCPGTSALESLARCETVESASILAHIRDCAACLDELKALRQSMKRETGCGGRGLRLGASVVIGEIVN
jgi:hypothetical protein